MSPVSSNTDAFDVFISHATVDDKAVDRLATTLTEAGLKVWVDHQQIRNGEDWDERIQNALNFCRQAIFVLSPASAKSIPCKNECQHIRNLHKILQVAVIEFPDKSDYPWQLELTNRADLTRDYEANVKKLIDAIHGREPLPTLGADRPFDAPSISIITDADVLLIDKPDRIPHRPRGWVGRENILSNVLTKLQGEDGLSGRVLIQGHPGVGKTAFAKKLVERWLKKSRKSKVLWLPIGIADDETIFTAIARRFGKESQLSTLSTDQQTNMVHSFLEKSDIGLLVLDDAWNGMALRQVLNAVPDRIPVLVTSRSRYELEDIVELPDLELSEAVSLLEHHARRTFEDTPGVHGLCLSLGNLPFAIEIAGNMLKEKKQTPQALLEEYEKRLHELQLHAPQRGRETIAALIDLSLNRLDDEARDTFIAFGAFFTPQITVELMALYRIGDNDNVRPVESALLRLHSSGLAVHIPASDKNVPYFRIHDLSYSYVTSKLDDDAYRRGLTSCLTYVEHHNSRGWKSFRPLLPVLDNLLGAAKWAVEHGLWDEGKFLTYGLEGKSQILELLGLYRQEIQLLEIMIMASNTFGDQYELGNALSHLGLVHTRLSDYQTAIRYHEDALNLRRKTGNKRGEGNDLGNLGSVYASVGEYFLARNYYEDALLIAREIGDMQGESNRLGNLGNIFFLVGEYSLAIEYHQQALDISKMLDNERSVAADLNNISRIYSEIGNYQLALDLCKQSLEISRRVADQVGEANRLNNLAIIYINFGKYDLALEHNKQSHSIAREIGSKNMESDCFTVQGNIHFNVGNYDEAMNCYRDALKISQSIDNRPAQANSFQNMGNVCARNGEYAKAITFFNQALTMFRMIGAKANEAAIVGNLGILQFEQGNHVEALEYCQNALVMSRILGNKNIEAAQLGNLGAIYTEIRQFEVALDYCTRALALMQEINNISGITKLLNNLGNIHCQTQEFDQAIKNYEDALGICKNMGDLSGEADALLNIGNYYGILENYQFALEFYIQAKHVFLSINRQARIDLVENNIKIIKGLMKTIPPSPLPAP